ncbi:MAG: hypothetical protein SFX73_00380 [Kofleriaceae bacterium]|nr:hypothetical protein [Kofleriaceae bacterium]
MINLRSSLFVVALGFSAAACQKAPDLGKVQAQALLTVKSYVGTLEVLQRRADVNLAKFRTMDQGLPGADQAGRALGDARGMLDQLRALSSGAAGAYSTAAKNGNLDELRATIDSTDARLRAGVTKVTADLTAFENWAAFARPAVAMNTPPVGSPPPGTEPANAGAAEGTPGTDPGTPTGVPGDEAQRADGEKPSTETAKPADGAAKPAAGAAAATPAKPATAPAAKPAAPAAKPAGPAATPAAPAAAPAANPAAPSATGSASK